MKKFKSFLSESESLVTVYLIQTMNESLLESAASKPIKMKDFVRMAKKKKAFHVREITPSGEFDWGKYYVIGSEDNSDRDMYHLNTNKKASVNDSNLVIDTSENSPDEPIKIDIDNKSYFIITK